MTTASMGWNPGRLHCWRRPRHRSPDPSRYGFDPSRYGGQLAAAGILAADLIYTAHNSTGYRHEMASDAAAGQPGAADQETAGRLP